MLSSPQVVGKLLSRLHQAGLAAGPLEVEMLRHDCEDEPFSR